MSILHTSDNQKKEEFLTRWYKTNIIGAKEAILQIAKKRGYTVKDIVDDFNEVYLVNSKFDLVLTITQEHPRKTAIDLSIESHGIFDFGKTKKEVREWYMMLDKELDFLGVRL